MTDALYGDNPIDPLEQWNASFRPGLLDDPEWQSWANVWSTALTDALASLWLTRWRRSISTATGEQLRVRGEELAFLAPDGWADDRVGPILEALMAASFARSTASIVNALADSLLDVDQSMSFVEEFPCSARFTFQETSSDEAITYYTTLDRARPRGCQFFLVAHPGDGTDPFTIDTSTIDGPDTLADLFS